MIENDLSRYISDRMFDIPAEDWERLKSTHGRQELQDMFTDIICDGQIDFPKRTVTRQEALEKQKKLMRFSNPPKDGACYFRHSDEVGRMYFECGSQYNDVSNYYHQDSRLLCCTNTRPSPIEHWTNRAKVRDITGSLFTMKPKRVNLSAFIEAVRLRTYVASQFKPGIAKGIYDFFNAERVVDPCSGWGDRLAGFFASPCTRSYFGVDPNTNLTEGYAMQIADYSELAPGKEAVVVCGCAEDPGIPFPECDLVFTSPPYFDKEHYSKDPGQSYMQYSNFNDWLDGFLFKVIKKSHGALVPGGRMCINIANIESKGTVCDICSSMVGFAKSIGFSYDGCMGIRINARPNSNVAEKEGTYCEPLYVFTKKTS